MKLYEINENINTILEYGFDSTCVDPDTGEILPEMADRRMAKLLATEEDAIEGIAVYIKGLSAEATALKQEKDSLAKRCKAKESKATYMKTVLANHMQSRDMPKYESPKCVLTFRASERAVITDNSAFMRYAQSNDGYLRCKEPEPDKAAIKRDLKAGTTIPGAELIINKNLQIK